MDIDSIINSRIAPNVIVTIIIVNNVQTGIKVRNINNVFHEWEKIQIFF